MVTTHRVAVAFAGGRYPHRPTCSCGWETTWGYLTEFAAMIVADDHKEFHMPQQGLHACVGCGVELDADDLNDRCEDCAA